MNDGEDENPADGDEDQNPEDSDAPFDRTPPQPGTVPPLPGVLRDRLESATAPTGPDQSAKEKSDTAGQAQGQAQGIVLPDGIEVAAPGALEP